MKYAVVCDKCWNANTFDCAASAAEHKAAGFLCLYCGAANHPTAQASPGGHVAVVVSIEFTENGHKATFDSGTQLIGSSNLYPNELHLFDQIVRRVRQHNEGKFSGPAPRTPRGK